jgi:VanZ family protein
VKTVLTGRHYGWLTVAYLVLVVYGSLVPFHFQPMPFAEAATKFRRVCDLPVQVESRSDWTANILLFIPLGFLFMAALSVNGSRSDEFASALTVVPFCILLSTAIELTQLFFPPRVSSLNDVVAESFGGLLGTALWFGWGKRITLWGRGLWNGIGDQGLAGRLLPGYLLLLVLIHLMPFDLTISPVEVYHKYREGRIQLVPFGSEYSDQFEMVQKNFSNLGYYFPVGLLLAGLPRPYWQSTRNWASVAWVGLGVAGLIEFLQLFVYSRFCNATDVITGGLAVLAGWGLGLRCCRCQLGSPHGVPASAGAGAQAWNPFTAVGMLLGWLGVLVLVNWRPFNFTLTTGEAAQRLQNMSWLPFFDYYQGDYLNSFDQILDKVLLFFPLGAILAITPWLASRRVTGARVVLGTGLLATGFEAGQLFLPTRYASVTDVLIESFGAWLGFMVTARVWPIFQVNRPPGRCAFP